MYVVQYYITIIARGSYSEFSVLTVYTVDVNGTQLMITNKSPSAIDLYQYTVFLLKKNVKTMPQECLAPDANSYCNLLYPNNK